MFLNRTPLRESVALAERTFTAGERQAAAKSGAALPGGGFPIKTTSDLRNAIKAMGRAKNPAAAKRHIIRRARALGKTKLLPEDWNVTSEALDRTQRAVLLAETDFSYTERERLVWEELNEQYPPIERDYGYDGGSYFMSAVSIEDLYDDRVIYSVRDGDDSADTDYYQASYQLDDAGTAVFGTPVAVFPMKTYLPQPEEDAEDAQGTAGDPPMGALDDGPAPTAEAVTGRLVESALAGGLLEALDADGWRWRVQVIAAGVSANRNEYPLAVLHEAVALYNGIPVFYGRGRDHNPSERGVDSIAGYITDPFTNAQGIGATFEINKGKPLVREAVMHAWDIKQRTGRTPFGFSHVVPDGGALLEARRDGGKTCRKLLRVDSADLVMRPAAGGGLLAPLAEAALDPLLEATMNLDEILARIRAGTTVTPDEFAFCRATAGTQLAEAVAAAPPLVAATASGTTATATAAASTTAMAESTDTDPRLTEALAETERRVQEALTSLNETTRRQECRALLSQRLTESRLPEVMRERIRHDFDNQLFEATALDERLEADRLLASALADVRPSGLGAAPITGDQRDRWQQAMDVMLGIPHEGVSGFRSLKEAYQAITGDFRHSYIDFNLARRVLQEAQAYAGDDVLLQESIVSSTFGSILGDSITRRMIMAYGQPSLATWRQIVSVFSTINDFRTNRRLRIGGYGDLPVVAQGAPYQPLASPADQEATYNISKRGGTEDLTLETIANDDMGVVRNIPIALGRAGARTIYHDVWNTFVRDNPATTYDATTWFHANHGNLGTAALSAAAIEAVRVAMRQQKPYGVTVETLGAANTPKILAVPTNLERLAWQLNTSAVTILGSAFNATEPNYFRGMFDQIIAVDDWADPNDWAAFGDPQQVPILEVGFLNGRQDPELFVQDAATVGSNFTADKVTYKIRYIYGIAILEHRGAYKNVVP